MNQKKKSFFYNPSFRVSVYILAWIFLKCFKLITLLNHNWVSVIERYEKGHINSAVIIGFASALIFVILFFAITFKSIKWNLHNGLILLFLYLIVGTMGALSITKYQDYEKEKYMRGR